MNALHQQVAGRLTRFYLLALTVIALLSVSGLLFIKETIRNHYDDSRIVNVAGRQRMLSQRLTKLALLRLFADSAAMAPALTNAGDRASFDSLLQVWSQTHVQLRNGTIRMEKPYSVRKSGNIDSMFTSIEPAFQAIYRGFHDLNTPSLTPTRQRGALLSVLIQEPAYLQQMNDIVFRFDAESLARVKDLERVEWLLTAATLLTLLIEGVFIFRPVVHHTRTVVHQLTESDGALRVANQHLERTNQELATANRQLQATQQELLLTTEEKHQLQRTEDTVRSAALLEGQEEERRRFARELHDGIGQMLTGLRLHAGALKKASLPDEKTRGRVHELSDLIQDIIQTTRQVAYDLMPSVLGDFGLAASLQLLAEQTARSSGQAITFDEDRIGPTGEPVRFGKATEIGLYRIAQEAVNNAVKHAGAQTIAMLLRHDAHKLVLSVTDDGQGFKVESPNQSGSAAKVVSGIDNMRTRARLLNGSFTLTSKLRKGTTVAVRIRLTALPT